MRKRIRVTSDGYLSTLSYNRGGKSVKGPILNPFYEDITIIGKMILTDNATVVEVLPDGKEIPLNMKNFKTDNS